MANDRLTRTDEESAYYDLSRRVYSTLAPFYDPIASPLRRLRHTVVMLSGVGPDARVLDVATGTGAQARAFAEICGEVVGLDLSDAMLRVARRKTHLPNVRYLQGDATALPFDDGAFDLACVSFALHEMPPSVREKTLREMARVTRPGGTVVIADYGLPHGDLAATVVEHAIALFERDVYVGFVHSDLRALLERAGVEVHDDRSELFGVARVVVGVRKPRREAARATS